MLTHTPNPMNFLNKILKRPSNEKPFVLLVVGYPDKECQVPKFAKQKKDWIRLVVYFNLLQIFYFYILIFFIWHMYPGRIF